MTDSELERVRKHLEAENYPVRVIDATVKYIRPRDLKKPVEYALKVADGIEAEMKKVGEDTAQRLNPSPDPNCETCSGMGQYLVEDDDPRVRKQVIRRLKKGEKYDPKEFQNPKSERFETVEVPVDTAVKCSCWQ